MMSPQIYGHEDVKLGELLVSVGDHLFKRITGIVDTG